MTYTQVEQTPSEDENAITSTPPRNPVAISDTTVSNPSKPTSSTDSIKSSTSKAALKDPKCKPKPPLPQLRYRRTTIYLLLFYLPLLIIPWVLTCVLSVRPLGASSYTIQWGGLSSRGMLSIVAWLAAVRVLNSTASLVTVLIISTLLAQAAIVYAQRRRAKQKLSIGQVFALADRGWSDITLLWSAFGSNETKISSRFLWLGAF